MVSSDIRQDWIGRRVSLAEAKAITDAVVRHLNDVSGIGRIDVVGSIRRRKETVGDLDMLVQCLLAKPVMDRLADYTAVAEVLVRGRTKMSVRLRDGLQLDLTVVPEVSYGAMLQCYTGSKGHTRELRRRANERGLRVTDFGVFRGRERVAGRTEEDVYEAIGMPWIPPELRESRGEFDLAQQGRLPNLLELDDIRGDLHLYAPSANGRSTLEAMVEAAVKRGYAYVAVADRPKSASRSRKHDARRLLAHGKAIEKFAGRVKGIALLKGVEVEILEDGTLDLADELLAEAEWVIARLRNGHNLPREEITGRLQNAIKNPHVHAVGGLTGRRAGESERWDVGLDNVFQAAADHGCILELNARPDQLDPDDVALMMAKERGVRVVINTEASSVEELGGMEFGVYRARRAGLEARNVVNTRTLAQLRRLLNR